VTDIETVSVDELQRTLGFDDPIDFPQQWRVQPLPNWKMAADDVILRYVFRNFRPCRHLEFGTWRGDGVLRCVEECEATVWTINVLAGETRPNGDWAYGELVEAGGGHAPWSEQLLTKGGLWMRTDSYGQIGRYYLDAGWGKRVCQVYADSREWDTRAYPDDFFDTAFIDGSHIADVVDNDTRKAIRLVRGGGLVVWHDFCPVEQVTRTCESTRDVVAYVRAHLGELRPHFSKLFWVDPSWLLFGIRATST
jgi:Methyltransferase domain